MLRKETEQGEGRVDGLNTAKKKLLRILNVNLIILKLHTNHSSTCVRLIVQMSINEPSDVRFLLAWLWTERIILGKSPKRVMLDYKGWCNSVPWSVLVGSWNGQCTIWCNTATTNICINPCEEDCTTQLLFEQLAKALQSLYRDGRPRWTFDTHEKILKCEKHTSWMIINDTVTMWRWILILEVESQTPSGACCHSKFTVQAVCNS